MKKKFFIVTAAVALTLAMTACVTAQTTNTPTPTVLPTTEPTLAPTATNTPTPVPTNTPTPEPTATNTPTPSPTPTSTPTPTPEPPAPEIGQIKITADSIGEEYSDITISANGIEGLSDPVSEVSAKIKVRGNTSKKLAKKSYTVKFNDKLSFFGLDSGKKWNLLATAYEKSLLRTPLGFLYAQTLGLPYTSQFHISEVWINEVYTGVYVLIEPVQEGKNRVDINLENGDFLLECNTIRTEEGVTYIKTKNGLRFETNEPEEPSKEQKAAIVAWLNEAEEAIVSMEHEAYEKYIDIDSFVNYYIFEELTKNVDFGRLSTRYFCKDGKLYAGPPWDMDLTMGNVSTTHTENIYKTYNNLPGYGTGTGKSTEGFWACDVNWYRWLCKDDYFMKLVVKRWNEMLPETWNLVQETEDKISRIDYLLTAYQTNFERNYLSKKEGGAGWKLKKQELLIDYDKPQATYTEHAEYLRQWVTERISWLDSSFNSILLSEETMTEE